MEQEMALYLFLAVLSLIGIISGIVYSCLSSWESRNQDNTYTHGVGFRVSVYFQHLMGHLAISSGILGCGVTARLFHLIHVPIWVNISIFFFGILYIKQGYRRLSFASSIIKVGGEAEAIKQIIRDEAEITRIIKNLK